MTILLISSLMKPKDSFLDDFGLSLKTHLKTSYFCFFGNLDKTFDG